jgi:hypothetical protein
VYEVAILSAVISAIVFLFYLYQSFSKGSKSHLVFAGFAFAMAVHNINLYTWLNLPADNPLVTPLRALDYVFAIPLLVLGVYLLHVSAEARERRPSIWAERLIVAFFVVSLPLISGLYLLTDPEFARRIAVIVLIPLLGGLPAYYFNHFRNNPYRIKKPEYERGYRVVILGYMLMVFGTGVFAGVLRLIDLGIVMETISVILIALGGVIIGTVTYAGLYEKMKANLLVLNRYDDTLVSNLTEEKMSNDNLGRAVVAYIQEGIERVFLTGNSITIPSITIDPLGSAKRFKVDIITHELGADGTPLSVMIVLTDVTGALEALESEQLSELLSRYKGEQEKSAFYLDLLSHDMGNIIQGILLGVEMAAHEVSADPKAREALTIVNDEINRSMILLSETKLMVRANETKPRFLEIDLIDSIRQAILNIHEVYPKHDIDFDVRFPSESYIILAESIIKYAFFSTFRFIVDNSRTPNVRIAIEIMSHSKETSFATVEVSSSNAETPISEIESLFNWHSRNPSGGVGLPLARVLLNRYNGSICIPESSDGTSLKRLKFKLQIPSKP